MSGLNFPIGTLSPARHHPVGRHQRAKAYRGKSTFGAMADVAGHRRLDPVAREPKQT
jgi:hypothetical protein